MPTYRISYPTAATKGGGGDTIVPVESYDLEQKVKASFAIGLYVTIGLAVLLWAALALIGLAYPVPWKAWAVVPCLTLIIGILVACWQGFGWVTQVAVRAWAVDDEERKRRHMLEDAELEAQKALAEAARKQVINGDDTDNNPLTFTDQQRLDFVALTMLERVYMYSRSATRDAMTQDGACTQEEWNLINQGMKAIGLRQRNTWQDSTFGEAWALWRENIHLETDGDGDRYLMVLKPNGKWHAIERIE